MLLSFDVEISFVFYLAFLAIFNVVVAIDLKQPIGRHSAKPLKPVMALSDDGFNIALFNKLLDLKVWFQIVLQGISNVALEIGEYHHIVFVSFHPLRQDLSEHRGHFSIEIADI